MWCGMGDGAGRGASFPVDKGIKGKSDEERAEEGDFVATQVHGDVWAWAAAGACVWVHGSEAAVVCVGVQGS